MKKVKPNPIFPPDDPRSRFYRRILNRPKLKWHWVALRCLGPGVALGGIFLLLRQVADVQAGILAVLLCWAIYSAVNLKKMLITLVQIYQCVCPDSIRLKCRYEPSCSQYMILSIEKYGPVRGLIRGIRRRSRGNNRGNGMKGGFDFP